MSSAAFLFYIVALAAIIASAMLRLDDWGYVVLLVMYGIGHAHIRTAQRNELERAKEATPDE